MLHRMFWLVCLVTFCAARFSDLFGGEAIYIALLIVSIRYGKSKFSLSLSMTRYLYLADECDANAEVGSDCQNWKEAL